MFFGNKQACTESINRMDNNFINYMDKFLADPEIKILPEFLGAIDTKYLNQKVRGYQKRINWMYLMAQFKSVF